MRECNVKRSGVFDMEYMRWLEDQQRLFTEVSVATQEHLAENELRMSVDIKMEVPENIVELYRRHCYNAAEMRTRNQNSEVVVEGKKFTRTIFRPNDGPDILVNQVVQSGRTFYYKLPLPVIRSAGGFRRFISDSELAQEALDSVTPQRLVHNSLENEWSWARVTNNICRYVSTSIDLRARDRFGCYCDEAFGELFIMDEGAYNTGQEIPQFEEMGVDDHCPLCPKNYYLSYAPRAHYNDPYADYLGFFCCPTLFHRRCILPWLWIEKEEHFWTSSSCPPHRPLHLSCLILAKPTLTGHTKAVTSIDWSTSHVHLLALAGLDGAVYVWNVWSNGEKKVHVKWSKQGLSLLSCGYDCTSRLFDVERGVETQTFKEDQVVGVVKFHPDNVNLLLSGGLKGSLRLWDIRSKNKAVHEYVKDLGPVLDVEFMAGGKRFISSSDVSGRNISENAVVVWDVSREVPLSNQVYAEAYSCPCIKHHPRDSVFIAQSHGNYAAIFSANPPFKLNKYKRYEGHWVAGFPIKCNFSPDGETLVSGSSDGYIYMYGYKSTELIKKLKAYEHPCVDVTYHPVLSLFLSNHSGGIFFFLS
ncbi:hypothetical protein Bca52824_004312 [Brassica carinata]|uniref:Uncharacterized protein n=1 Tax=Brassica carinata TaxID=52824 RepID=A0A8X8BGL6_BRACI|nr:hypothetical protein Bca52824_004312 [Brassica carinata]